MKSVFAGVVIALLAGCAAAPKPSMNEDQYAQYAKAMAYTQACGTAGYLPPETASLGLAYVSSTVNEFTYDPQRLNNYTRHYLLDVPTVQECNAAAIAIMTRKRQINQHNAAVAADQKVWDDLAKSNRPRQPIYCNSIGTQTICN